MAWLLMCPRARGCPVTGWLDGFCAHAGPGDINGIDINAVESNGDHQRRTLHLPTVKRPSDFIVSSADTGSRELCCALWADRAIVLNGDLANNPSNGLILMADYLEGAAKRASSQVLPDRRCAGRWRQSLPAACCPARLRCLSPSPASISAPT